MTPVTALYGRKASEGHINWITAIAMSAFHVGAVAAFFFIDAGAILAAVFMWFVAGSLGIGMAYHRLLTHRGYKTLQVGRVLPHDLRHARPRGRSDLLGRDPPHPPSVFRSRKAIRTRRAKAPTGRTWVGSSPARRCTTTPRCCAATCRISARIRFHVALTTLALGAAGGRRPRLPRLRRHSLRALGRVLPHHLRPALHVAGQLGDAPLGLAPLQDARRFDEQLVGGGCSRSAKAGTTTITRTRCRRATAWPGTSSTSTGSASAR